MQNIAVLGTGTWGTALLRLLANKVKRKLGNTDAFFSELTENLFQYLAVNAPSVTKYYQLTLTDNCLFYTS